MATDDGGIDLGDFDLDLGGAEKPAELHVATGRVRFLYFDVETIPDDARLKQFGLPPVAIAPAVTPLESCLTADNLAASTIDQVKDWLAGHWPSMDWIGDAKRWEAAAKKPRAGILALLDSQISKIAAVAGAADERRKLLSITPEYCRLASLALAADDGPAIGYVVSPISERQILDWFWAHVARAGVLVGFNIGNFDLNVILMRSAICGVKPTDDLAGRKPWDPKICDLMIRRWPRGGQMKLKQWAKVLGVDVPAGDVDGGEVFDLFNGSAEDRLRLRQYNESDVVVTREIHKLLMGYYW